MRRRSLPSILAVLVTVAGCTTSTQRSPVRDAAVGFVTAVQDKNGQDACTLLTDEAEESVSGATDVPCEQAVLNISENGATVHSVQIWGDAAQVKLGSDTVFLRRLPGGWQVRAAGCRSQPGAAYRCDVAG